MNLILIPAKANSSRVPQKNFRPFYKDLSLVDISIDLVSDIDSTKFVSVLSTDLTAYESKYDLLRLHHRLPSLSRVETPILDVMQQLVVDYNLFSDSKIILLQPTSPFRNKNHLNEFCSIALSMPLSHTAFSVYKVVDGHPARMYYSSSGNLVPYSSELSSLQSQDLPDCYHRNGCFYAFSVANITQGKLFSDQILHYEMPYESSINIDTIVDFHVAQNVYPLFIRNHLSDLKPVLL